MRYKYGSYIPFSYKMMLPYLLLVMLTDAIVGYFSYRTAVQSRTELVEANVGWTLQQIRDNVRYQMADLQAVSDSLFSSTPFQQYLQVTGDRSVVYETTVKKLVPLLETPLKMSAQNLRLIVYVTNPNIDEIYGDLHGEIKDRSYYILSFSRLVNSDWYNEFTMSSKDNVWHRVDTDEEQGNISLLRKLISFNDYQTEIGYLRIAVPLRELFLSFATTKFSEGTIIRAMDKTGAKVLYQNETKGDPRDPSQYLLVREEIAGTDIYLESMVPMTVLQQDAGRIRNISLLVCGVSFVVMAAIGFVVARYSGRKMMRIVTFVRTLHNSNFTRRIAFTGNDEFAQISAAFNQMAHNIDELIREVYVQRIEKKEAELEALQAQINPHFLYNTLSSINSLANIGETEKLCAMVTGLAKFYRLTLNDGNIVITLANEINQVKAYLDIQAIKYANRFTVGYTIEPGIERSSTIKLILQPFVENVLEHAWFEERIHIRLVAYREGETVVLKVIDDGIGMMPDKLRRINERAESTEGYGIRNVHDRIRLQYGDGYGVDMFSRPGIGTTVRITLPYDGPAINDGGETDALYDTARR